MSKKTPVKHFSGTLRQIIRTRGLTNLAICEKSGLDPAKLTRLLQDVYRADRPTIQSLRPVLNATDYAAIVRAHVLDEVGTEGLQLLNRKHSPKPLMPQTQEILGRLASLPDAERENAERVLAEVANLAILFRSKPGT